MNLRATVHFKFEGNERDEELGELLFRHDVERMSDDEIHDAIQDEFNEWVLELVESRGCVWVDG